MDAEVGVMQASSHGAGAAFRCLKRQGNSPLEPPEGALPAGPL